MTVGDSGAGSQPRRTGRLPVSVVIPAFNRARLLPDALDSVERQRPLRPAEVIVVDDGSSDDTAAVAKRRGARVIRHRERCGAAAARNSGFAAVTQPWVALLDSDDEWLPHHLATLWRHRAGRVLVSGAALACGEDATQSRYHGIPGRHPRLLPTPAAIVWPENSIATSGTLVRTDAVRAAGGFDASLPHAEDFDLWIRLLENRPGLAVPVVVYRWRSHPGQTSKGSAAPRRVQREIVRAYAGRPWWNERLEQRRLAAAEWDDLRLALAQGRRTAAARSVVWLLVRPVRVGGVLGLLVWRWRLRRRTAGAVASVATVTAPAPRVAAGAAPRSR
jgi:glycosyltransferase involved in cell wall biosynthesis